MYIGIDIGGTKTLVAVLNEDCEIVESIKFPTPPEYDQFLVELETTVASLTTKEFTYGCVAMPGHIDRKNGIGIAFGNLPWRNVPLQADCEAITHCPFVVENDAKLAGLSEAMLLKDQFSTVLYVTVSTGIGIGLTINGKIDETIGDGGGHEIMLEHEDKIVPWESFASGRAIVARYGKRASEIDDPETWKAISRDLSLGLWDLIAIIPPEAIVIGGGVATNFAKFAPFLEANLKSRESPMIAMPKLLQAQRPEEAVVYGCYYHIQAKRG